MQIPPLSAEDRQLQEQLINEGQLTPVQLKQALSAREKAWQASLEELTGVLCRLEPQRLILSDFPTGDILAEFELRHQLEQPWNDQLAFVDPGDGHLVGRAPAPRHAGLLLTPDGNWWFGDSEPPLPYLGEADQVRGYGACDSDLTVSPKGDLLFVSERHHGRLNVISLVTHKLLTSLKVRETGHASAIQLVVAADGKRALLTDQISSRLWILDLGTWKLSPLQTGLGKLGALTLTPDGRGLYLSTTAPSFRLLHFDMQTLSVIQEFDLPDTASSLALGAAGDGLVFLPDGKRLLLSAADGSQTQALVQTIRPGKGRVLGRYTLNAAPLALVPGRENPLASLSHKSLGEWLVELGLLQAQVLVRLQQKQAPTASPPLESFQQPTPDDSPVELLQRPAPPIGLPREADDVLVDSVVQAAYQESGRNLREFPERIQALYAEAADWRLTLESRYAVQAGLKLGARTLPVLLTRASLLEALDIRLEGREIPWRPAHRCPMCQTGMQTPRHCEQCGFQLEDPSAWQRRAALSAEACDELIPGQLLLALPQANQLLLLNAWHELIFGYELKALGFKQPFHALALPNRHYLICDRIAARVAELTPDGRIVRELEHPFVEPVMSTFYLNERQEQRLLVVDRGGHAIHEFDARYQRVCSWSADSGLELDLPRDVQRTWNDTLLIADTGHRRVLEVDRAGRMLASWGPPGIPLEKPVLARREVNGDTLIVDAGRGQIVAFSAERQLVRNFRYWPPEPALAAEPAPGRLLIYQRELLALSAKYWMQVAVPLQTIRWVKPWTGEHRSQHLLQAEAQSRSPLQGLPFLKDADPEALQRLEQYLRPESFGIGEAILHQGELGSSMYFVLAGVVEILKEGQDRPLAVLGPGNIFGEMALILGEPRIASARAKSECRLLALDRRDFSQVIADFPALHEHLRKLARERKALTHGFNHQKQLDLMRRVKARMALGKLQELAFFRDVEPALLETLADAMRPVAFMPRHRIFAAGESGDTMYFLTRGQVQVSLADDAEPVARLETGDVLGEMALLLNQPRSATVHSEGYSQCFELDRQMLEHIAGQYPAFQKRLQTLAEQRTHANQDWREQWEARRQAAELAAVHEAFAAEVEAALAGAEVIGSSPPVTCYLFDQAELVAFDAEGQTLWRSEGQLGLFRPGRLQLSDGIAWIADTGNDRVLALETSGHTLLREIGNHLLPLSQPRSAVPTAEENLLIADEGNQRLVMAGPLGNYLWEHAAPHEILSPVYAEQTASGSVLFCDAALHMVYEIDPASHEVLWCYGNLLIAGDQPHELNEPGCVRRLSNGATLIADTGNHRLLLLGPKGQLLRILTGSEELPLQQPVHCEPQPDGAVLVWNRGGEELLRFDLAGEPIWRARLPVLSNQ